jgi:hypothetical protein
MDLAPIVWRLSPYQPHATEYARDSEWQAARRTATPALRLTRYAVTEISGPGAMLPLASYRVPLDDVPPAGPCIICGGAGRKSSVMTAGLRVHDVCAHGEVTNSPHLDALLMFAEELPEVRSIQQVMSLRRPDLLT